MQIKSLVSFFSNLRTLRARFSIHPSEIKDFKNGGLYTGLNGCGKRPSILMTDLSEPTFLSRKYDTALLRDNSLRGKKSIGHIPQTGERIDGLHAKLEEFESVIFFVA